MTTEQRGKEWNLHFTKFMFISPHILTEFVDMVFGSKYFFHFHDSGVVVSNSCKPSGTWEYCKSILVLTLNIIVFQTHCSKSLDAIQHTWSNIHHGNQDKDQPKTNQPGSGPASGTSPRIWSAPPSARRSPSLSPGSCRPSTARSAFISWERGTM